METIEKLKRLHIKMKEILNNLSRINDDLTKVEESNSYAISVNGNTYKKSEIIEIKNNLNEQIRIIKQNIIPSLEDEIKELENK